MAPRPATPCRGSRIARATGLPLAAGLLVAAGCGAPPSSVTDADVIDAVIFDAAPPDADVLPMGPALGFDTIALTGANLIFGQLGAQLLNPQLEQMISGGQFLLVFELRDLDDPAGGDDVDLDLGIYSASDSDADPSDNFDAEAPEQLIAVPASVDADGNPVVLWGDATIASNHLTASGPLEISLPGGIPLPLQGATIDGVLVASSDHAAVDYLDEATLSGSVPASVLGLIPNLLTGTCPGSTLLDVMINGCGLGIASQPDVDLDGDGLEWLFVGDTGVIERCVDGDHETEILGTNCWSDPAIADGYRMVFTVHATRVDLVRSR